MEVLPDSIRECVVILDRQIQKICFCGHEHQSTVSACGVKADKFAELGNTSCLAVRRQTDMLSRDMHLTREHVQAFQKAYKHDVGEDLTNGEAFEMLDRLVNIFLILERAEQNRVDRNSELPDEAI